MKIELLPTISFYDYSQVVYVNMGTPITIGCPIHGTFKQRPVDHIRGKGCGYCSGNILFNQKTKEETKEYWLKHKILSSKIWRRHWKENNLQEQGYRSTPWGSYKMSVIKWIDYIWNKKKTKEETKEYWIKHKITGSRSWCKHWKDKNLRKQRYFSNPWSSYKMTQIEWTEYVYGKKK